MTNKRGKGVVVVLWWRIVGMAGKEKEIVARGKEENVKK